MGAESIGRYRPILMNRVHAPVARALARGRAPTIRLLLRFGMQKNFAGAQLRGLDLCGLNLRGVSFRGANLSGALIDGGGLEADFSGAILHEANIYGLDLSNLPTGIELERAKLFEVRCSKRERPIAVSLRGLDLHGAQLRAANFRDADLRGADLSHADLREAILESADLGGRANLRGANLSRARLYAANLARADLTGANLRDADLREANLSGCDLQMADLTGADLCGTILDHHPDALLRP